MQKNQLLHSELTYYKTFLVSKSLRRRGFENNVKKSDNTGTFILSYSN